jgi:MFS transporter, DHA3 family, macrolide efflux protein
MSPRQGVLSNGSFLRVWSGQLVSLVGDRFYAIALAVWIVERTGSSRIMAALLIAAILPGLLIGPFAGALADRWNRKAVMIAADLARAAAVSGVALLCATGLLAPWMAITAAAALSLASAFFSPALLASLPRIVDGPSLEEANSLSQLGGGLTSVLGPACGAAVLALAGYAAVFWINAASFLVSAGLVAVSRVPSDRGAAGPSGLGASVAEGMRHVARSPDIVLTLSVVTLAHFAVGGLSVALPFLARSLAGAPAANLGWLEAVQGAGLAAGSIILSRTGARKGTRMLFGALAAIGVGMGTAGLLEAAGARLLALYLGCSLAVGAAVAAAAASWTTILQRGTPDALRGRVFGISTTIGAAFVPVGMGLAGAALDGIGFGALFAPVGAGLVLAGLLFAAASGRLRARRSPAPLP